MLTETNIRCFLSLAETLSFTRTARELYMSQQAVSQHISRLEEEMGFPLFIRTRRTVALTPGGRLAYDFWNRTAQELSEVKEQGLRCTLQSGALHIGYQDWMDFGPAFAAALRRMEQEHPDAVIEGMRNTPGVLLRRLEERELNLVLLYERFVQDFTGLRHIRLLETPIMLMVSSGNPNCRPGAGFSDFITEPFILDSFPNESSADTLRRAKREIALCGLKPTRIVAVNSRDSAYTEAELGRGVVLTTGLSRITRSSNMLRFPTGATEHIICLWNENEENPLVTAYAACLKEAYAAQTQE